MFCDSKKLSKNKSRKYLYVTQGMRHKKNTFTKFNTST